MLSKPVRLFQFCHSFFKSPIRFSISFWANTNVLQWPRECLWSSLLSVTGPPSTTLTPSSLSTGVLAPIWTGLAQGVIPGFSRPGMSEYPLCFLPHFLQVLAGLPSPQWGVFPSLSMRYHLPSPALSGNCTLISISFHFYFTSDRMIFIYFSDIPSSTWTPGGQGLYSSYSLFSKQSKQSLTCNKHSVNIVEYMKSKFNYVIYFKHYWVLHPFNELVLCVENLFLK